MHAENRIAPDIFRQRFLVEGYHEGQITQDGIAEALVGIARDLDLRTYGEPVVYSPESGMGKAENAGFDAFVPLVDSGISAYVWIQARFVSVLIYACKAFDEQRALASVRERFALGDALETTSF